MDTQTKLYDSEKLCFRCEDAFSVTHFVIVTEV